MKALSLWQPWASLCVHGLKQYETRGWACPPSLIGKPVALHATKTLPREAREIVAESLEMGEPHFDAAFLSMRATLDELPRGAVLGIVRVTECHRTEALVIDEDTFTVFGALNGMTPKEYEFGNFGPARFAWRLEVVERFAEPIAAKGMQGIWEWADPRTAGRAA